MRTLKDIQPGQTLGRYEFLVPIAEGGMASVWAARLRGSRGFSKTVAIKTMLPGVSDDVQFEQMFLDEAQIASRIRHPNVVEILDLGEEDEILYLVMEWVDGEPLSSLRRAAARQGGIPRGIAVRIVADACAGLHAAHELKDEGGQLVGLVHRDISPQNLLITFDGAVKIVDFGVAKAAGRSAGQTTAGQVKGKPPYMSPEQALGEPVDRRTDIFALGIILYQLTTGKHPFRGESDLVTLQNIVSDRPIVPPRAYDKQYPRGLEAIVMKALDRRRDARFQTCAEFEAAIDEVFSGEMPRARTEDVARFVREQLGDRGEARRRSLTEAIRAADERAALRGSMSDSSVVPVPSSPGDRLPIVSLPELELPEPPVVGTDPHGVPVTPYAASVPSRATRRGPMVALAAAAVIAVVLGVALTRSSSPSGGATATEGPGASAAAAPVESAPPAQAEPQTPPPAASEAAPETTPGEAAPPAEGEVAAPDAGGADSTSTRRSARPSAKWRAATGATTAPEPKPAAPKPGIPRKTGFVPPPVSNPGF